MRSSDEAKVSSQLKFYPFYERLNVKLAGTVVSKIGISALLGLAFLALHYAAIGKQVFSDWSWFLAVLIGVVMLCLYFATATLRTLVAALVLQRPPPGKLASLTALTRILSDRNFVFAGSLGGLVNCIAGYSFGLPYAGAPAAITILIGYFLAGFICGMAVLGIYAVCVTIVRFSETPGHFFDFTAPDGCGGTLFVGQALVVFSSVSLIAGVMISIYIIKTNWTGQELWWAASLKGFWIVAPYIMSLLVLIVPAIPLHSELLRFKEEQEVLLKRRLAEIRKSLEDHQSDAAQRKDLRDDYEFGQSVRRDLHKMRTWPFGTGTGLTYIGVFGSNVIASKSIVANTLTWLRTLWPW